MARITPWPELPRPTLASLRYFVGIILGSSTELNEVPLDPPVLDSRDAGPKTESARWKKSEQGVISYVAVIQVGFRG